jgi:uncharacterized membrane protein (DUF2068 family)
VDWSTLACGRSGHVTYAADEPDIRAQLAGQAANGEVWQCLRCGAFVPGPPALHGPAAQAPSVPRGRQIRSRLILKVFAVERFLRALIFGAVSVALWRFRSSQGSIERAFNRDLPAVRDLFAQLGYNIQHSRLVGLVEHALFLDRHTLTLLAAGTAVYAGIELVEAAGLWLARRWGEYFAMIATSLGLPLEIYDLSRKVTVTALVLLAVNLALVLYLAITKRLFGIRGGKRAYDERLREDSVMAAASEAARTRSAQAQSAPSAQSAQSAHSATLTSPAQTQAPADVQPPAGAGTAADVQPPADTQAPADGPAQRAGAAQPAARSAGHS